MTSLSVCLFAKAPAPGRAKTRLIPALGADGAAALSRALLLDALDAFREADVDLVVATTGDVDAPLRKALHGLPRIEQEGDDLGARMEHALRAGLERAAIAVVVGSDVPGLGRDQLSAVQAAMANCDAVFIPAEDGGFGLLALRSCPPGLLRDLPWSTPETLLRCAERLEQRGMRIARLQTCFDVDRPSDLVRLAELVQSRPTSLHHSRAFLASSLNESISVIVPARDEAQRLPALLDHLQRDEGFVEIIVVDGESSDGTAEIARAKDGIQLVASAPGRARQMNAGAKQAIGGTLLFLHADTILPMGASTQIRTALRTADTIAGAFRIKTTYDPKGRSRPWIRPFLGLADLRSHYSQLPYGDQALFVRAQSFRDVGGFPSMPLFEDLALAKRLRAMAPLRILPGPVQVSARRFQERPLYYFTLMNTFPLLYRLGVAPSRLERWYRSS